MESFLHFLIISLFIISTLQANDKTNKTVALIVIDMSDEQWNRGPGGTPIIPHWPGHENIISLAKALPNSRVFDSRIWLLPEDKTTLRKRFSGGIAGTKKAELTKELNELSNMSTFVKKIHYSAFYKSSLQTLLEGQNVTTLLLTGINTDYCVLATAIDAFYMDYEVLLIEDATATFTGEIGHYLGIQQFKRFLFRNGKVINTSEALNKIQNL